MNIIKNWTMTSSREQEIILHHEKWKRWKLEMENESKRIKQLKQKPDESAHTYAEKIIQRLAIQEPDRQKCPISSNFQRDFESNACSICYELMIPPRVPVTLFPCGHNMCKMCLFENGDKKQKNYKLRTRICGLCDSSIENYAENKSLMNLICTYTDNKHLIEREEVEGKDLKYSQQARSVDYLKLRCEILQKQRRVTINLLTKQRKNKQIIGEVLQKLMEEKKKNTREITALEEEAKLIENFLRQKKEELQKIKSKIATTEQKKRVVEKTLEPLRIQKQKLQILEAVKLIQK